MPKLRSWAAKGRSSQKSSLEPLPVEKNISVPRPPRPSSVMVVNRSSISAEMGHTAGL
jgi:hypothetical protein